MKKLTLIITVVLSIILLSGCTKSTENNNIETSFVKNSNGNLIITDNVTAEFGQIPKTPSECCIYKATIKSINDNSIDEYFFNFEAEKTSNGENILLELNNKHAIVSDKSFVFYTDNGNKFDDAVSFYLTDPSAIPLDNSLEFSFATKENAINDIMTFIEKIDMPRDKAIIEQSISMTKENFNDYKAFLNKTAEKENDSKIITQAKNVAKIESEDFYYFDICFSKDNIPIYSGPVHYYGDGENDTFAGTRFTVVYTCSGIEYVSAFFLYQPNEIIERNKIIDFNQALNLLKNKYENIFFDSKITFEKAELVYLPFPQNTLYNRFNEFILRPFYAFYGYQDAEIEGDHYRSDFTVYFDAVSGKEL
ncbi:MAG: hypothetical protein IK990_06300 [Ruminiclostridium sp.]|nr:hypothetical protein [Ruminiclostridium sp.]